LPTAIRTLSPSASSGDRLLLEPAGEGEDILNEESTPPYNVGRREGNNDNTGTEGKKRINNNKSHFFEEGCLTVTPQFPPAQ
jgi:hypothetical protein